MINNSTLFLSLNSMIQIYMIKKKKKKLKDVIIISKEENINKNKTIFYLNVIIKYSEKIEQKILLKN